jgi:hypothetical protein
MALTANQVARTQNFIDRYCQGIPREHVEAISGQLAETVYSRVWELGATTSIENFEEWLRATTAAETRRQLFELQHARRSTGKRSRIVGPDQLASCSDPRTDTDPERLLVRDEHIAVLESCMAGIDAEARALMNTTGGSRRGGESIKLWAARAGVERQTAHYRRKQLFRLIRRRLLLKGVTCAD